MNILNSSDQDKGSFLNGENKLIMKDNSIVYNEIPTIDLLRKIKGIIQQNISYGNIIWNKDLPTDQESINLIREIENILKKNNKLYSRFSSDYMHAKLSYDTFHEKNAGDFIYENDETKENVYKKWKIEDVFCYKKVYKSVLYFNEFMGQMILAHKGIDSKLEEIFKDNSNLNKSIKGIICNEYVPELLKCYQVTEYCFQKAREKKCTLSFTGYSNGAWLSEFSIYFCEKFIKKKYQENNEEYYVEVKAVLFESPGIFRDENEARSNIISTETDFDLNNLNIVNYLLSPNLMNSTNKHIGKVYRIFLAEKDNYNKKSIDFLENAKKIPIIGKYLSDKLFKIRFLYNGLYHTFTHSILQIILDECFENEKPKSDKICQMLDWPLIKIDMNNDYKDNFNKYLSKPIDYFVKKIPFINDLSIITEPFTYITSNICSSVAEKLCPGIVILFNLIKELSNGNINIDNFDNLFFYENPEIEVIDKKYIEDNLKQQCRKHSGKKKDKIEKKQQNETEIKFEKKFSLFYQTKYVPKKLTEESKRLNIQSDHQNIDWCLYQLSKKDINLLNFGSNVIRDQLIDLKQKFSISEDRKKERNIIIINKRDTNLDFDFLKEFFLRLISISDPNIKDVLSNQIIETKIKFFHNLGERIKFTHRDEIFKNIKSSLKKKNLLLIYGPPGIGKTTIAKEYGFISYEKKTNVYFFRAEQKVFFINEFKKFLKNKLQYKSEIKDFEELADKANELIAKDEKSQYLLIYDNIENFDEIKLFFLGLTQLSHVEIIITARSESIIEKNIDFKKIKIRFFNETEAKFFIEDMCKIEFSEEEKKDIIEPLKKQNDINPLELYLKIKYLNDNYFNEENAIVKLKNVIIFDYVYEKLDENEKSLLEIISFLNPDKISNSSLKNIFCKIQAIDEEKYKISLDCLEKNGLIEKQLKKRTVSIHRIFSEDVRIKSHKIGPKKVIKAIIKILEREDTEEKVKEDSNEYYENLIRIDKQIGLAVEKKKGISEEELNDILVVKNKIRLYYSKWAFFQDLLIIDKDIFENRKTLYNDSDHPDIAASLNNLGLSYSNLGDDKKAKEYNELAYEMRKRLYKNSDHPDIADSLNNLANIYSNLGDDQRAKDNYELAYEMRTRIHKDSDHSDIASSLFSLANIYSILGNYQKANEYDLLAYEMRKRLYNDSDHPDIANSLYSIGLDYLMLEEYQKAKYYNEQAYEMKKRLYNNSDHPDIANSLNSLAVCYEKFGDHQRAKDNYVLSYEMRKRIYKDSDHLEIAISLNNLGVSNANIGDFYKAKEYYERAYEMLVRIFKDSDHREKAASLVYLGNIYSNLGDDQQSKENHELAYEMRKRLYKDSDNSEMVQSLNSLAKCFIRVGDFKKGFELYNREYEMRKRLSKDSDNSEIADTLNNLGGCSSRLGDNHKALEYFSLSYKMKQRLYNDSDHSEISISLFNLAVTYSDLGCHEKALGYFSLVYEMRKRLYKDTDNCEVANSIYSLAVCNEKLGDDHKANEYFLLAYNMRKKLYKDKDHCEIANSLFSLAINYGRLCNDQKAKEYFLLAYEMRKRLYEDCDHVEIAACLNSLATCYSKLGDFQKAYQFFILGSQMIERLRTKDSQMEYFF